MRTLIIVLLLSAGILQAKNTGEQNYSPVTCGEELPNWFFEGGCIVISDPISDTTIAYQQAVQRALASYTFVNDTKFASVYEYYYLNTIRKDNDYNNQKSHWIAEFETTPKTLSYKVEKTYRTKYKETIVLLDVTIAEIADVTIATNGSFMYHYDSYDDATDYGEKQMMIVESNDTIRKMVWNSTIDNNKYLKRSYIDDAYLDLKKTMNSYNDFGEISEEMVFSKCEFGLWNSFIDTYFQALTMFESKNVIIENTTRQIINENDTSYGDKSQNIARLVMKTNLSCRVSNLSLKNNCLYANWEIIER